MAMARIDLEKFNGKNDFNMWKVKMEALLITQGLGDAIEPVTKKEGKETSSSRTPEQAAEIDNKARSTIILSLGDSVIREVAKERTVAELWAKLDRLYMTKSLANILYIKKRMFTLKMGEGSSLDDHIDEFNKVCDTLETIDEGLDDEGLIAKGKASKGDGKKKQKQDKIKAKSQNLKCFECHKEGHFKRDCPEIKNKKKNQHGDAATVEEEGYESAGVCVATENMQREGIKRNGVYVLDGEAIIGLSSVSIGSDKDKTKLWHLRLGHMSIKGLMELQKQGVLGDEQITELDFCEDCVLGKTTRSSFKSSTHTTCGILDYIHSDLWGPAQTTSLRGNSYFLSIIDDFSKRVWVYVLKHKDQVFEKFKEWKSLVENQTGRKMKKLRTDNGLEFCNQRFDSYCAHEGIARHKTVRMTPQQNGLAERMNRTLMDKVRCMLVQAQLPKSLWVETLLTACYLVNLSPSVALDYKTPFEVWHGKPASYDVLRVFGCPAYAHIRQDKLAPRLKGQFIGYPEGVKGYKLWCTDLNPPKSAEPRRFKARLVAKGYTQKEGVDFKEVFSPVVRHASIRVLLALTAVNDMELDQLDVKTAFLHGRLEEEILMTQPEGYIDHKKHDYVCLLKKSLYGLKQSPRQWYLRFDEFMISHGYLRCNYDCCVHYKLVKIDLYIYLLLYVDDMLVACKSRTKIEALKQLLNSEFDMKHLGQAKKILGMEIRRNNERGTMFLTQRKYLERVLASFGMTDCKSVKTPLAAHFKLSSLQCPKSNQEKDEMSVVPYANAVRCMMYAMVLTRPDISHALSVVSRYMASPGQDHWQAAKWILRYLKGTLEYGLVYGRSDGKGKGICGFVDADFAGDLDRRRSLSGYIYMFDGCLIDWKASLQHVVALSTTEAEYTAAAEAVKEALWLKGLMAELGLAQKTVEVFCDSSSAIYLSKNPAHHERTKHIDIKLHFIRNEVSKGVVKMVKIHTDSNPADMLTKVVSTAKLKFCLNMAGLCGW
ncbi:Integrase catalytic domain-containing protein [Citrus sinensis]|nr:Integrase catalytic domain-containing protein [Citrus sinensis]